MATEKKLDCVILGLLSHENLTGYEIKKRLDTALSLFWGASFGSIYPTLKYLVEHDLALKSNTSENSRGKISYTITEKGREHLKGWLEISAEKDELRFETLLKLFFAESTGAKTALEHIESFETKIQGELQYLQKTVKTLEAVSDNDSSHFYYLLTARFGVKAYRAYLEWCSEVKTDLNGHLR